MVDIGVGQPVPPSPHGDPCAWGVRTTCVVEVAVSGSSASLTAAGVAPAILGPSSPGVEYPETGGAGSVQWQRARLGLDQHPRGAGGGPVGRVLPGRAELAQLLPYRGLRRGSTVVVRGSTTVLLALLAEATAD